VTCEPPDPWRYITVDVTEAVKYEYGHLGSTFGIALMDISDARPYVFTSETGAPEQRPYLHIMIPEPVAGCMVMALIAVTGSIYRRRSL
jgi:hypothetical protein